MLSDAGFLRKAALEEQETRIGEHRVLQYFATEATSDEVDNPLMSGLDVVVNEGSTHDRPLERQERSFATPWRNFYDGSVYVYLLDWGTPLS